MNTRIFGITALTAALLAGMPVSADVVGVSRCDQEENGVFRPGLMTVAPDGTRTFHPVGEDDLTETIVFNRAQAFGWVEGRGLFPAGTTFVNYDDYICGMQCEECAPEDVDAEPDDEGDTNGQNQEQEQNREREGSGD